MRDNRYVVRIEAYVFGKDDYHARMKAHKMLDEINSNHVNADAEIAEIGSQPFASHHYRKLKDHSRPSKMDGEDDKPLPF